MHRFRAEVWRYQGDSPWHFVTLPVGLSDDIAEQAPSAQRGFGSVRVRVSIGRTRWATSIFPDKAAAGYVLPLKAAVRKAEGIAAGDTVTVQLEVLAP